ncbi:MAG: hypothetical protein ACI4AO_04255 [Anaerotignum sp.]
MTRGKDIFWGAYAALLPILFSVLGTRAERMVKQYVSRTFDTRAAFYFSFAMALLLGISLGIAAVRFLSKPTETSRLPFWGLCIGLGYCVFSMMYWPLSFMGIDAAFILKISPIAYGSTKTVMFMGFYCVLLIAYLKTYTFVTKEELQKGIEK